MIRIIIADDSETERSILKSIFQSAADIEIVACAKNGREAVEMTANLKPDLITMDIHMPLMDGFEAIRHIMSQNPIPIVVISSTVNDKEINTTFKALAAGALSVLAKPSDINSSQFTAIKNNILQTIRSMAEIKVIKRRFATHPETKTHVKIEAIYTQAHYEIVAIGTSVGGPQVLKKILSELPANFPVPIVIVQHMTQGFINGFVKWLN
ncbi:MAG: response regulator, partial [Gammaproteobacteria bacterium]|nr:response regulator [Gammaproteobacteria bacterium]